jgi:hypothetical protein
VPITKLTHEVLTIHWFKFISFLTKNYCFFLLDKISPES